MFSINKIPDIIENLNYKHFLSFIFFLATIFTALFDVALFSDSNTYIEMDRSRSPIYPIFLNLNKLVFGEFYLKPVIFFQFFIYFFSIYYFLNKIYLICNFDLAGLLMSTFFLVIPSFYFGNSILSESISFSFFILLLAEFIGFFKTKKTSNKIKIFFFFILCSLTKPQLLFIFGVLIYIALFLFLKSRKDGIIFFIGTILSLIFIFNFNKAYHYFLHDKFESDTNLGSQLIAMPVFLSTNETLSNINQKNQKRFLNLVLEDLKEKNINFSYHSNINKSRQYWIKLFQENYAQTISSINQSFNKLEINENQNKFLLDLSFTLLKINFKIDPMSVVKGYFFNFAINGFYWIYLAICFFIFTFVLCVKNLSSTRICIISLTLTIFALSHFFNIFLVTLIEPVINRYRFITEVPFLALIVILIFNSINIKKVGKVNTS